VGLPRRRRGAGLVPGTAAAGADEVPGPRQAVDADALRSRLGSFQAGMHRGRREVDTDSFEHAATDGAPGADREDAGQSTGDRDREPGRQR
jgi:hypothetical protein